MRRGGEVAGCRWRRRVNRECAMTACRVSPLGRRGQATIERGSDACLPLQTPTIEGVRPSPARGLRHAHISSVWNEC